MHVVVWSHFERFKQAFHLGRFWDTKKVRPAYIRERVVTPRTPRRV
ncbi:hypothetical protein T01_10113 [Trichinella spiralis]|uniref:Uncharacterized protein n=1 Tax=Trichinella spiralis TaxID=6334 RepID=A0A0V0YXE8_TRISP|nr:hypothetical protein T01_10113 [Trichinella spiralis]